MAAKDIQNLASGAKRAATTLRNIANMAGVSKEDSGIMLAAARAVESFARTRSAEAKELKAKEIAHERFCTKAKAEAIAIIKNEWPQLTLLDKAALIAAGSNLDWLMRSLNRASERTDVAREINYYLEQSIQDEAGTATHSAWRGNKNIKEAVAERARRLIALRADLKVSAAAGRLADLIERSSHQAAA